MTPLEIFLVTILIIVLIVDLYKEQRNYTKIKRLESRIAIAESLLKYKVERGN